MAAPEPPEPRLDFLVIGAMKAGTTTLWRAIDSHPEVLTPSDKERGFFNSDVRYAEGLARFVATVFPGAEPGQRVGTVTPHYLLDRMVETVAPRIRATVPDVRLVAILRDPIERALSHFRQAVRTGDTHGETLEEHLRVVEPVSPRGGGILANGDYGRLLTRYLDFFDRDQLLLLYTDDLEEDAARVYREIFAFLGVDTAHRPPPLERLLEGGTRPRVDPGELGAIETWLEQQVWPRVDQPVELQRAFRWWLRYQWNVVPGEEGKEIGPELRARLQQRYVRDAELLCEIVDREPPWLARYRAGD